MEKKEIYEMVISELSERALAERRKNCDEEEKALYKKVAELSQKKQEIVDRLSEEEQDVVNEYISLSNQIAYHEEEYLYEQGAKDCIELLKKLGVL